MQIPHGLLPWAILAPFLSIGISRTPISAAETNTSTTKSVPDCATGSRIKIEDYPNEFWIEVVFLKPIDEIEFLKTRVGDPTDPRDNPPPAFRPNYPLRIQRDFFPFEDALLNRLIITRYGDARSLFIVTGALFLYDASLYFAKSWPDSISNWTYSGFNPIVFDLSSPFLGLAEPLDWSVEKVCDSKNHTELRLQVVNRFDDSTLFFFLSLCSLPPWFTLLLVIIERT